MSDYRDVVEAIAADPELRREAGRKIARSALEEIYEHEGAELLGVTFELRVIEPKPGMKAHHRALVLVRHDLVSSPPAVFDDLEAAWIRGLPKFDLACKLGAGHVMESGRWIVL